jgi:hypothetical protein
VKLGMILKNKSKIGGIWPNAPKKIEMSYTNPNL